MKGDIGGKVEGEREDWKKKREKGKKINMRQSNEERDFRVGLKE